MYDDSRKKLSFGLLTVTLASCMTILLAELILTAINYQPDTWSPWIQSDITGFIYANNLLTPA